MQIRILKGTTFHGKPVAEGDIIDVDEATFRNFESYKLAEKLPAPGPLEYATTSLPAEQVTKRVAPQASKTKK